MITQDIYADRKRVAQRRNVDEDVTTARPLEGQVSDKRVVRGDGIGDDDREGYPDEHALGGGLAQLQDGAERAGCRGCDVDLERDRLPHGQGELPRP